MIKWIKILFLKWKAYNLNQKFMPVYNSTFWFSSKSGRKEHIAYTLLINGRGERDFKVFNNYKHELDHPYYHNHLRPWKKGYRSYRHKDTIFYKRYVVINGRITTRTLCDDLEYRQINAD